MGAAAPLLANLRRAATALAVALGARRVESPRLLEQRQRAERLRGLCADLQRLDAEVARLLVADSRTPALKYRLQAASWAYDLVLRDACRFAGVPARDTVPFEPVERLRAEAELAAAGVRW